MRTSHPERRCISCGALFPAIWLEQKRAVQTAEGPLCDPNCPKVMERRAAKTNHAVNLHKIKLAIRHAADPIFFRPIIHRHD